MTTQPPPPPQPPQYPSPPPAPYAVFSGMLGDNASGGWLLARAEVGNGLIALWVELPSGWTQYFSVRADEVTVKSAAQRITLVVHGQTYPLLADARAVGRAIGLGVVGGVADVVGKPGLEIGADLGRGANVAGAARAFQQGGGPEFLVAARQSGARTSRLGYGPLLAIGCGGGLLVVVLVTVITLVAINF